MISNLKQIKTFEIPIPIPRKETANHIFSCEEAALEVTFQLVNQSKSIMSCNFRHSDILFVCVCVSVCGQY